MKVVITHTDLRLYWPARILALQQALENRGDELFILEIAGAGSPYAFAGSHTTGAPPSHAAGHTSSDDTVAPIRNWFCLFPDSRMEDIPPPRASRKLVAKLNELSPDVLLSGSIAYPSGAAAVYWAKAHNRAVIIFDDVRPENVPRNHLVNYIKRLIYQQVDAVLCPAQSWTASFQHWNFQKEQIFFGVDVVDNDFWAAAPTWDAAGLSSYFLAVGRQILAKNFGLLLEAYEHYRHASSPADRFPLVFIGEGPERQLLESYTWARGMQEDVYFFPFATPEELRRFYHHAAALVLPSRSETWGLVVNEAMASSLPVFVSQACGCASVLVQEGVNGYTFSPDDLGGLTRLLIDFTEKHGGERTAMGAASAKIIRSWGLDQFVKGCLEAIAYASAHRKPCRSMPARLVLKNWKGRYRPV